ncbi:MAG: hypothetical protein ABI232_02245 [Jatrophihabitantaceae bacterium]
MTLLHSIKVRLGMALLAAATCIAVLPALSASGASTGSISGTVRVMGTGAPLAGIGVGLYQREAVYGPGGDLVYGPTYVTGTTTASDGTYTLTGLAASGTNGYWVCFVGDDSFSGQCYQNAQGFYPFPDPLGLVQMPSDAKTVSVGTGQHVTGIDTEFIDPSATGVGAISGKVTQNLLNLNLLKFNLAQVKVTAFNAAGVEVEHVLTTKTGTYLVSNLPVSHAGYAICFSPASAKGGITLTGFHGQCFANAPWAGFGPVALGATAVPVTADATTSGVDVVLSPKFLI